MSLPTPIGLRTLLRRRRALRKGSRKCAPALQLRRPLLLPSPPRPRSSTLRCVRLGLSLSASTVAPRVLSSRRAQSSNTPHTPRRCLLLHALPRLVAQAQLLLLSLTPLSFSPHSSREERRPDCNAAERRSAASSQRRLADLLSPAATECSRVIEDNEPERRVRHVAFSCLDTHTCPVHSIWRRFSSLFDHLLFRRPLTTAPHPSSGTDGAAAHVARLRASQWCRGQHG